MSGPVLTSTLDLESAEALATLSLPAPILLASENAV